MSTMFRMRIGSRRRWKYYQSVRFRLLILKSLHHRQDKSNANFIDIPFLSNFTCHQNDKINGIVEWFGLVWKGP